MDYKKPDWKDYFNVVADKPHREILENAVQQNTSGLKTAIDCGCGVGADAAYLLSQGYEVIAFDKEARAINISGGIFLGDFVGPEDSWVHSPNHSVHAVTKNALDVLFCDFDILALHERDELAPTALGNMKHWHTFTVLARKN